MLKILTAPNAVLTAATKSISKVDKRIKKLVADMEETLLLQSDPQGVGLAAPQVGYSLALFIIKARPAAETQVFINPRILSSSASTGDPEKKLDSRLRENDKSNPDEEKMEGCLSVPRIWAPLKRTEKVRVEWQDLDGQTHKEWFSGLNSIIVQHEIDHLKGILFTQRCLEQKVTLYEEKGEKLVRIKSL